MLIAVSSSGVWIEGSDVIDDGRASAAAAEEPAAVAEDMAEAILAREVSSADRQRPWLFPEM